MQKAPMAAGIGNVQFLHSVPGLEHNWDDGDDCNIHLIAHEMSHSPTSLSALY